MELNGLELDGAPATLDQVRALALTNYGHFTSMLVEDDRVRGLSLHMQRLFTDCAHLFGTELDTEQVRRYVRHALAGTQQPTVIRVTIYDPALDLGTIGREADPHVLVTARTAGSSSSGPLRLQAVSYRRDIPAIKHVGLFGTMQRRREAQRAGFDDALFLNADGTISEIATSNIGFVRDGQVIWPRSEILAGVTMRLVHQALDEPVATEAVTLSDLPTMDAAFATNAVTGIRPVASVDDTEWPSDHESLKEIRELYADIPAELV
jgi:branched-subunit amino acid aminotransferase/4-amino-4-deoxychorismate lyase